ncbi:MAG: IS982 family transposase [SAR324 cluster bacterium]|nr:IS982 family transposase [SAR324 cluster bacterium]
MDWQDQLIRLYVEICELSEQELFVLTERYGNNNQPHFTDNEVATVYLWGILSGHQTKQAIHKYARRHLLEWFPDLPKYSAYVDRVNRLGDFFCALTYRLFRYLPFETVCDLRRVIDSMPIMIAKRKNSYRAKVASELADRTWHPVKEMYYYGVKLHAIAFSRPGTLPLPEYLFVTNAAQHDLEAFRPLAEEIVGGDFIGDKAYIDSQLNGQMRQQETDLITPIKRKRNDPPLTLFQRAYNTLVSKVRQPIESFFNWLEAVVSIEDASKVRSSNGLIVHIWGKLTAAILTLAWKL